MTDRKRHQLEYELKTDPHELKNLVKIGETIRIPSIYLFADGKEITAFLAMCDKYDCTVLFEDENLRFDPKADAAFDMVLLQFRMLLKDPRNHIYGDYKRWLESGNNGYTIQEYAYDTDLEIFSPK